METQQSGHALRSGLKVKMEDSAKDGAPERLRCRTIQEEVSQILQKVPCKKNSCSVLSCIGNDVASL